MAMKYDVDADFDTPYLEQFGEQIQSLAEAEEDVTLELSRVNFVDSSGLGALVALHKKLVARGYRLRVLGLRGQPLQLFINLKLVPVFCS
jgi:anti-sigma B factor antagonist